MNLEPVLKLQVYEHTQLPEDEKAESKMALMTKDHTAGGTKAVVEFTAATVSVLESEKKVRIGIRRYGKLDTPATVRYITFKMLIWPIRSYKYQ
jgi:hypothetical protein